MRPYHIARRFASLDHLSGGRAGWNIVTTSNPDAALNFGLTDHMEHGERYRRAREFYDAVTGLWDSWADDAFVRDVDKGLYFDPERLHVLNHAGEFLKVRGPLNIARPIQGWPVIVQAGASDSGRQLAAETAEVVFTAQSRLADGQSFYADVKGRMEKIGRSRDHLKILPGALCGGRHEPSRKRARSARGSTAWSTTKAALRLYRSRSATMPRASIRTARCPRFRRATPARAARERVVALAKRENLTVKAARPAARRLFGARLRRHGQDIADEMEEWLVTEGSDGFNVMFPYLPGGLDDFVDQVVPELQRRGLFRREYEGPTLRDNLGLPRPKNRFF